MKCPYARYQVYGAFDLKISQVSSALPACTTSRLPATFVVQVLFLSRSLLPASLEFLVLRAVSRYFRLACLSALPVQLQAAFVVPDTSVSHRCDASYKPSKQLIISVSSLVVSSNIYRVPAVKYLFKMFLSCLPVTHFRYDFNLCSTSETSL